MGFLEGNSTEGSTPKLKGGASSGKREGSTSGREAEKNLWVLSDSITLPNHQQKPDKLGGRRIRPNGATRMGTELPAGDGRTQKDSGFRFGGDAADRSDP